ncbi:MAG: ABC transporter ATP-binding protein [Eubacteriales bacterium]|nr:ABC transporter ATP-binding protein [Eubacteriales bacterium]
MLKKFSKYMNGLWLLSAVSVCGMIVEAICELAMPSIANQVYERVSNNTGDHNEMKMYIIKIGLMMLVMAIVGLAGGLATMKCSSVVSQKFSYRLRKDMYSKISDFSFKNIDQFSTSSLTTRMTNDVTMLQNTLMMCLRILVRAPALMLVSAFFAFSINAKLSLVLVILLPIVAVIVAVILKYGFPLFQKMQKKIDNVNRVVQENLIGIRVVKAYVREDREKDKFHLASDELAAQGSKAAGLIITVLPLMMLMLNAVIMGIYYKGSVDAAAGKMAVGEVSVLAAYIAQVLMNILMVAMLLLQLTRAKACGERVIEVLDTEIDITNPANPYIPEAPKGKIEFKNVDFGYHDNDLVLENINWTAPAGSIVGIIGSTGCGKSSMVNLIPRLYDTVNGQVLIDDVDVKDYDLTALRDLVGVVLQKNLLFSGSIKDNIRWGKEDATDEEIVAACKAAQAHDFIMEQPDGYDTDLSQGGLNLSGGQKQRLCIARAMIKQPKILILDDSTSAVDTATESKIRESFYSDLKDTTVLIIAQRISSVKNADMIIVLDEGKVVSVGNHEQLMQECNIYQEIYKTQQKGVME